MAETTPSPQALADVVVLQRYPAPVTRPQAIAFDGQRLWVGSIDSCHLHAIDPATWAASDEGEVPGNPWGLTAMGGELRVLCGETAEDFRRIRRFVPGQGVQEGFVPCPEDSGSHLGLHAGSLTVSQWYKQRIVVLDGAGEAVRSYALPHGVAGHVVVGELAYVLGTDDEAGLDYWITKLDLATGEATDVARIPFHARGLAHDGTAFWTNVREQHELLNFQLP